MGGSGARLVTGPPPEPPAPELVARAVFDLRLPKTHPVLLHLRATAHLVAHHLDRLQAREDYAELIEAGFGVGEALGRIGRSLGRDPRTVRRWLLDRTKKVARAPLPMSPPVMVSSQHEQGPRPLAPRVRAAT